MNLDALLAPISDTSPCGDDLSFSAEFDAIREMRRADDPSLDQGEWVTALKTADWPGVLSRCEGLLATRSKDLGVAAWLTDAKARLGGYVGLADGLGFCHALCERYWGELYPRIDSDGDADQRSGNLRWLLSQVEGLARALPVLRQGARSFSLHDIDAAAQAGARSGAEHADDTGAAAAPSLTPDAIAAARRATPREFFASNDAAAQRALQMLEQLQTFIDAKLGNEGPGFSGARRALEDAAHAIRRMARDADPQADVDDTAGAAAGPAVPVSSAPGSGPLRSRADALRQLRAVAEFFRRTEPHSPVAYLAERAAQWGEMPLHTWLRTVLKDPGALSQVEELLGVPPPPGVGS